MSATKATRAQDPAWSERWLLGATVLAIAIALLAGGGSGWRLWVENERLRAANSAAANQIETLNTQLSDFRERLTASQQSQSDEKVAHEQTSMRLKIKETELAYLKKNLNSAQNELLNLADTLEANLRSHADLTAQVEQWRSALSERDEILASLEKELANTYDQLDEHQASRSELEQRLAKNLRSNQELLTERDKLQNRLGDLTSHFATTLAALEQKFDKTAARLYNSHTALNGLNDALLAARRTDQTLSDQQLSLEKRLTEAQNALAQTTAISAALGAEKIALETRLHSAINARQALLQQHQKLFARIAAAGAACGYISAHQEILIQRLQQMSQREHLLLAQYNHLQTRITAIQAELSDCQKRPPDAAGGRKTDPQ